MQENLKYEKRSRLSAVAIKPNPFVWIILFNFSLINLKLFHDIHLILQTPSISDIKKDFKSSLKTVMVGLSLFFKHIFKINLLNTTKILSPASPRPLNDIAILIQTLVNRCRIIRTSGCAASTLQHLQVQQPKP